MAEPWYQSVYVIYPLLAGAGFVAGVVNTIAGGGSFLTLPALMFLAGLDPKLANGTNRLAVLLSSGSAVAVFHRHGHVEGRAVLRVLLPRVAGMPAGILLAVYLPPQTFQAVFGALFLAMALFLAIRPGALLAPDRPALRSRWGEALLFLAIGVYIGFIQAGMGIILLVAMSLFHARELIGANGIKNAVGFLVTLLALAGFALAGQVRWLPGLAMAAGNLAGGLVGARLAIHRGEKFVLAFVLVVMVATGVKLVVDAVG